MIVKRKPQKNVISTMNFKTSIHDKPLKRHVFLKENKKRSKNVWFFFSGKINENLKKNEAMPLLVVRDSVKDFHT